MARQTRHATESTGDSSYPGIVNQGYVSDYFLAYRLDAGLADLYSRWDERERNGDRTPRLAIRSLSAQLAKHRPDAAATGPDAARAETDLFETSRTDDTPIDVATLPREAVEAQAALNDAVLEAFGWSPDHERMTLMSGDTPIEVPVLHRCDTASGLLLVALGGVFATEPTAVVASKDAPAGTLLDPVTTGNRVLARTALEAAQVIFTAEEAPSYVLICSGGAITLLDRDRWGEGVLLGANLDDALSRADHRSKGELAAIAALFSADSIDPGSDAQSALAALVDKAASESAGVSKELRHGMRRSVELLAAAVVDDIRYRQKKNWQDIDADELTRQCLRYLYRIIVLLFAEARPELGILPVNDRDYQTGYSISRLRDTALVDLHGERAANATHIQQSLDVLFSLVDSGYEPPPALGDVRSIEFPGLKSKLFGQDACPMLDRAQLPDPVMQQVLANLCFTREQSGRQRQSLSYATLGINQLGAVYEGLMAYRGFLATEPLYEVDNDGDADTGTWVVPVSRADEYSPEVFVTEFGPDDQPRRVEYKEGDFVFRLAGRDRQRSASYYTPEVLTEFTVRHALDVYEEEHPNMAAADWLALTVCEPALGSGAFANEAINQLATRYLKAAQQEAGETINPDRYQYELQKTKAHFAINRTYGVDLNQTAVELAEVSLWLNVMHEGLTAPRFDARLRRGNSLIGARRATYTAAQVAKAPWKGTSTNPVVPPTDLPISEYPLGSDVGIHHFLLPGEGWGCAADAVELKGKGGKKPEPGLAEEWCEQVREWRKEILKPPTKPQIRRLEALSRRVEQAWAEAAKHAAEYLRAHERQVDVWGADTALLPPKDVKASGARFLDAEGPAARLRLLMDAWCALWFWAPVSGKELPTFAQWLDAAELLLGQPAQSDTGELFSPYELQDGTLDSIEVFGKGRAREILERCPWLASCQRIAAVQAFFHWEVEFAAPFELGGFDIQVGNPPWVRLDWDERASLSEHDPWWSITDLTSTPQSAIRTRRREALEISSVRTALERDRAEIEALTALLAAGSRESELTGIRTNLYMVFMTTTWRRAASLGIVGLVHPESHFVDPKAGLLRQSSYSRLRRHWHFVNEAKLFPDPGNRVEYGVHIYGSARSPDFLQACNLQVPSTVDRSLEHDGSGDSPSIQFADGVWDLRPHRERIVRVNQAVLSDWVKLFDEPGTPPNRSRLMRPLTGRDLRIIGSFAARSSTAVSSLRRTWRVGLLESDAARDGSIRRAPAVPSSIEDVLLQGPHLELAGPFIQEPGLEARNHRDWHPVELGDLPESFVPRTVYSYTSPRTPRVRKALEDPHHQSYREAHREFVNPGLERTIKAALIPPRVLHLHSVNTVAFPDPGDTARWCGLLCSLPYDYVIKVSGATHISQRLVDGLPWPLRNKLLDRFLALRVLRLNCLTQDYSSLWGDLYGPEWRSDSFVAAHSVTELSNVAPSWSSTTPLRSDIDRWIALVEIDAISALLLDLEMVDLVQMYRSQFPVLRAYEHVTVFDANGHRISKSHHNRGTLHGRWEAELRAAPAKRDEMKVGMWDRVQAHLAGDTEVDLGPFVPPFVPADREAAMSKAYQAFEARLAEA